MYRFVVDPENQVLPDLAAKLPGRGLWIKADRVSLQSAIEKKLFDKTTRQNLKIKEGLLIELETLQSRRLLDLIRLAQSRTSRLWL